MPVCELKNSGYIRPVDKKRKAQKLLCIGDLNKRESFDLIWTCKYLKQ